jgi:hypothetical protein
MAGLTSVKERDYLDQDPELRGQKYVCLSFLSPEDVIKQKEVFTFNSFITTFAKDLSQMFDSVKERFKDDVVVCDMISNVRERYDYVFDPDALQKEYDFFKETNTAKVDAEYLENNDFQTCVRGIKVRGVYETIPEAKNRANAIKKMDPKFDVYVAEVGCWCPWSPRTDDIENQEYSETQLNTLMKKYRENLEVKDEFYRVRMEEMVKKVKSSTIHEGDNEGEEECECNDGDDVDGVKVSGQINVAFEQDDPWTLNNKASTP